MFENVSPDLIYLGLVLSMWFAVTAAYVPGTGIIEGLALLGFGATVFVMMSAEMAVSWFAVLLIVIGVSLFIIMPFIRLQYAPLALGGLALQGIGGLLLFSEGQGVSVFVLALSLMIPAAYHHYVLLPMLRNMRDKPPEERDRKLIGMVGRVTKVIDPIGTVYVNSEHWSAMAEDEVEPIAVGEKVLVIGREELRLIVEPLKMKRSPSLVEEEEVS
jgi:membrane-bound ClpP family serine protease